MSRAQALTKRLAVKGDPSLPRSSFPRPVHTLFPDQAASNGMIIKTLSTELSEAIKLARQAEAAAQSYHTRLEAVNRAGLLKNQMQDIEKQLEKIYESLVQGMHDRYEHGDASPPDLNKETCLDPTRHATFLALLPSVVQEFDQVNRGAKGALHDGMATSLRLKDLPGIDVLLKTDIAATMQALEARRDATERTKEDVLGRAARLKDARRLWDALISIMDDVEDIEETVLQAMDSQRWKAAESRRNDTPITPEADSPQFPATSLPLQLTPHTCPQRLDAVEHRLSAECKPALSRLQPSLEKPVSAHLQSSSDGLVKYIGSVRGLVRLWDSILKQVEAMTIVQRDGHELEQKIDALQNDVDDAREDILRADKTQDAMAFNSDLNSRTVALQKAVRTFTDSLAVRLPFVSRGNNLRSPCSHSHSLSSFPAAFEHQLKRLKEPPEITLPFDLSVLDNDVRGGGNALALSLAGGMQSLAKKLDYLNLSRFARTADSAIQELSAQLNSSEEALSTLKASFESLPSVPNQSEVDSGLSDSLALMAEQSDQLAQDYHTLVTRLTLTVEQSMRELQAAPGSHDSPIHGTVVLPRMKASDDVLQRGYSISGMLLKLKTQILEAKEEEKTGLRLQKERLEAEERSRIEAERLKAERERQEEVRLQEEEKARLEELRLQEEEKARLEELRLQEEEKTKLEELRLQEEEKTRLEELRLQEEKTRLEQESNDGVHRANYKGMVTEAAQQSRTPDEGEY